MLTRVSGRLVVAIVLVAGLSAVAIGAPVTFDGFTSPGSGVQTVGGIAGGGNPSPAVPASNFQSGLSGILFGNSRTITAQRQAGTSTFGADVNTSIGGMYAFANGPATGSVFTINYNFAAQGFALDFSSNGLFQLTDVDLDAGSADFFVTFTDGTNTFTTPVTNVAAAAPPTDVPFILSDGIGGVNEAAITGITVTIDTVNPGIAGSDGFFDDIEIDDSTQITLQVPEPASMALFGLIGLGGVIAARRKMRKNAG